MVVRKKARDLKEKAKEKMWDAEEKIAESPFASILVGIGEMFKHDSKYFGKKLRDFSQDKPERAIGFSMISGILLGGALVYFLKPKYYVRRRGWLERILGV